MPYTRTNNYNKPVGTPAATPAVKTENDVVMADATRNGAGGAAKETPAWLTKIKEGGVKKVPKDVQKRRRNFRIKKMLTPKPPMMALFELVKPNEIQFDNFISDPMTRLLKVAATYNGQTYEGIGPSKAIAKNICCEQILQHIAFSSCTTQSADSDKVGEESTPWTALASVALFKLFNDWQAQGVKLPTELMKQSGKGDAPKDQPPKDQPMEGVTIIKKEKEPKAPKQPKGPKALPDNPTSRHPVQLLNEMEGQLEYDCTSDGIPPHANFTVSVVVKGQRFSGTSKNKKEAKKLAAAAAMGAVYAVHYPVD